jgi:hypothetical protein
MNILLTPDQEATMKAISGCIYTGDGIEWYHNPCYMKSLGNGVYEQLRFGQLPDNVKDMVLAQNGIKFPIV